MIVDFLSGNPLYCGRLALLEHWLTLDGAVWRTPDPHSNAKPVR